MILHHDDVGLAVVGYVLAGLRGVGGVDANSEPAAAEPKETQTYNSFPLIFTHNQMSVDTK